MAKKIRYQQSQQVKLFTFFILLVFCFHYPLISIFNFPKTLFGVPILYIYIFSVWLMSIIVLASLSNPNGKS